MQRNQKDLLLAQLHDQYKQCQQCPLAQLGRTNIVFGHGNSNAQLMIIGEGPGQDEDIQGLPFVGRSGKLLTKMLTIAGIKRESTFITNIVKCRPPNNRKPAEIESYTCKNKILMHQINIIQPKIICTLGAAAIEALLEQKVAITKIRGTPLTWNNTILLPTLHPAYVLRNPPSLVQVVDDLVKAVALLEQSTQKPLE